MDAVYWRGGGIICLLTYKNKVKMLTEEGRGSLEDSRRTGQARTLARSRNRVEWRN